jgi:hypothetical protein
MHRSAMPWPFFMRSRMDALPAPSPPPPHRRLLQNPAYYDLEDASPEGVSAHLSQLVEGALADLAEAGCVTVSVAHGRQLLQGITSCVKHSSVPACCPAVALLVHRALRRQQLRCYARDVQHLQRSCAMPLIVPVRSICCCTGAMKPHQLGCCEVGPGGLHFEKQCMFVNLRCCLCICAG